MRGSSQGKIKEFNSTAKKKGNQNNILISCNLSYA